MAIFSILSRIFVISSVYVLGRYNFSGFWILPMLLSSLYDYCQTRLEFQRIATQTRSLTAERDWVLPIFSSLELPPWITFPDIERAEWINTIFKQLWPRINELVTKRVKDLQPMISKHFSLEKFQFKTVDVGKITPLVTGVKVYDKEFLQNHIVVDINFSYYGDAEMSFIINGIEGGIKNIDINGTLRIVLIPGSASSLISSLEISFIKIPTFDFELLTALAPLDMFVSGDLLRAFISDQISRHIVFPNKRIIKLESFQQDSLMPNIEGVLRVRIETVEELEGLNNRLVEVLIKLGNENTITPQTLITDGTGAIHFEGDILQYPQNDGRLNMILNVKEDDNHVLSCKGSIDVTNLKRDKKIAKRYSLIPSGSISVAISWLSFSSNITYLQIEPEKNSAVLQVMIDSVRKLPKNVNQVFVELSIDSKIQKTSSLVPNSLSWRQHFTFLLVDPGFETLTVKLIDQLTSNNIGYHQFNVSELMKRKKMEQPLQVFPLDKCAYGSELLMMQKLRVLTSSS